MNPKPAGEDPRRPDAFTMLDKTLFQIRVQFESLQLRCDELRVQRDLYESEGASLLTYIPHLSLTRLYTWQWPNRSKNLQS